MARLIDWQRRPDDLQAVRRPSGTGTWRQESRLPLFPIRVAGFAALCLVAAMAIGALTILPGAALADSDPPPIPNTPALTAPQIVQLLTAGDYSFTSYGRPLRGTTHWDNSSHKVSGNYVYAGIFRGSFQAEWNVVGDKSCTKDDHQGLICSSIYAYGPGFMEVTGDGKVLAVSVPK